MAQLVKNLPATWETWVWSLGWEDPLEKKGYPLQYSGLENLTDCLVHGLTESDTTVWLSLSHILCRCGFFPCVSFAMLMHLWFGRERCPIVTAFIWFLSAMNSLMCNQVGLLDKSLPTFSAYAVFLSCMNSDATSLLTDEWKFHHIHCIHRVFPQND